MVQRNSEYHRITSVRRRSAPSPVSIPGLRAQQELALGALVEAREAGPSRGSIVQLNIGEGKTLITLLAARILGAAQPLLVVMAPIRHQTLADIERYREMGFDFPTPRVCSYRELSNKNWAQRLTPDVDLIVCDESQKLKSTGAGVTTRILAHCRERGARLVVLSGNIITSSIMDIWHLGAQCLDKDSPLPMLPHDAASWAGGLDADVNPAHRTSVRPLLEWPGADFAGTSLSRARAAWIRRVAETPGCYIQPQGATPVLPLEISWWADAAVPPGAQAALDELRAVWVRPDGHQLLLASEFSRAAKTLAYGFYHYWEEYPGEWWYEARRRFAGFVGQHKGSSAGAGLATDGDVVRAFPKAAPVVEWIEAQRRWRPVQRVAWLDESLCAKAAHWAGAHEGRIAWYRHPAVGECMARHAPRGVRHYPAGTEHGKKLVKDRAAAIASWPSHGTGLNLQRFYESLVLESPVGADKLNQLIGRLRRTGQTETVKFWFPMHTEEIEKGWFKTIERAEQLALSSQSQAILEATWK
jgi:hypothetical protein